MKLTFLGTGTSSGVPVLGCHCAVCDSSDPRDKRFRTAALLEEGDVRILIDAGPDIRMQLMPFPFAPLDAVLLTHVHYDHVGGLDDLRGFCKFGHLNIYADSDTIEHLLLQRTSVSWCAIVEGARSQSLSALHRQRHRHPANRSDAWSVADSWLSYRQTGVYHRYEDHSRRGHSLSAGC